MGLPSILTRHQVRLYGPVPATGHYEGATITATVRHDDQCGNGRNTFSITGEILAPSMVNGRYVRRDDRWLAGGCLHAEIVAALPELAPLIRFHLVSTDGPMHYIPNTLYWLGYDARWCNGGPSDPPNLANARGAACWPDMPESMLADLDMPIALGKTRESIKAILTDRLESVLADARAAVESLGMVW